MSTPPATRRFAGRLSWHAVALLLAVASWYAFSELVLTSRRRFLLPPPHEVVRIGWLDASNRAELLRALGITLQVAGIGLVLSVVIASVLAALLAQSAAIQYVAFPYLVIVQAVPVLALVPIIGLLFDYGTTARTIVCVLVTVFPLLVTIHAGLTSVDPALVDLFRLHEVSRVRRLLSLLVPAAIPSFFDGLRVATGLSLVGAIVGEYSFGRGDSGVGQLIRRDLGRLLTQQLWATVLVVSAVGVVLYVAADSAGQAVRGRR